jgi:hypothetical protein
MDLTPENRAHIDSLNYEGLLSHWRFAAAGDPWFQGETGAYWQQRMTEQRAKEPDSGASASTRLGWDRERGERQGEPGRGE